MRINRRRLTWPKFTLSARDIAAIEHGMRHPVAAFRSFSPVAKKRLIFGMLLIIASILMLQSPAQAGTANLIPDGDSSVTWTANGTGNGICTANAQCDLVDEAYTTPNTSNFISAPATGAGGETDDMTMSTFTLPAGVTNATSIDAKIYATSTTNALSGMDTISVSLYLAGAFQTAVTITPTYNTWGWYTATFTGNWTQTDIDNMRIQVVRNVVGTGKASSKTDNLEIATMYATVNYPTIVSFNQTAARWFSNWDGPTPGLSTTNPTTGADSATASTKSANSIYTVGYTSSNANDWRISKRRLSDGAHDTNFGTSGIITSTPSANDDRPMAIDQDDSYIYVAGYDSSPGTTDQEWRIEKRDKSTGALVSGFGTGGVVTSNPTTGNDVAQEVKVDGSYVYVVGYDSTGGGEWRIEKRDKSTGALVSGFGAGGVVTGDYSTGADRANALVIDSAALYIGGYDNNATTSRLRIEKRDITTGALVTGFNSGGVVTEDIYTGASPGFAEDAVALKGLVLNAGSLYIAGSDYAPGNQQWRIEKRDGTTGTLVSGFGTGGVVQSNPSTANDTAVAIRTDGTNLYVGGVDRSLDANTMQYRYEARDLTTGALVSSFGTGGVVTSNPSTGDDELRDLLIDNGHLYAVGSDSVPTDTEWRMEGRNTASGSLGNPLAAQNTAITAPSQGTGFRLRMLIGVSTNPLPLNSQSFKLQYSPRSGTCDTAGSGESYVDMSTTSGAIRFYNNPTPADGATTASIADDPQNGTDINRPQTYAESQAFSNTTAAVAVGEDGLWDFSLVDYSADPGTSYCFRAVKSDGSTLTYTTMPEITTSAADTGIQYDSDHITKLSTGGLSLGASTHNTYLDFIANANTANDVLTPQVEVANTKTSFTGTTNYSGASVNATFAEGGRRYNACSAYDSQGKRMITFGGRLDDGTTNVNDAWALNLPANAQPSWTQLTANGAAGSPPVMRSCAAAYDSTGNRFLVWDGWNGTTQYNQVWSLSLGATPTWTQLCTATSCGTAPSARRLSAMIYDPVGNQLITFAGYTGSYLNDTWKLTLGATPAWTQLTPTGGPPGARYSHVVAYDSVNKLMWMFSGVKSGGTWNDTWKYDIANNTWTQMFADGCASPCPTGSESPVMVYDSVNQQMVMYGGNDINSVDLKGASVLTNLGTTPTWSVLTPDSEIPFGRYWHTAVYDPLNLRMISYGGYNFAQSSVNKDVIALYLPKGGGTSYWRGIAPNNVHNGRDQMSMYYDSPNKYTYIFGGFGNGLLPGSNGAGGHIAEFERLETPDNRVPRWRNASPKSQVGGVPIQREAASFAADTVNKRLYIFGGLSGNYDLQDTWVADMSDGNGYPSWKQLCSPTSCGTAPPVRWGGTAVYDAVGNRLVIFGGIQNATNTPLNDVWALSLGATPTWTQLTPSGTAPAARWAQATVYDQANNRMIIFGGQDNLDTSPTVNVFNDTWALSLGATPTWTQLTPTGTAPAVRRSMAYALSTSGGVNKLVSFGGWNPKTSTLYNDVATLDLSTTNGAWTTNFPNDCANATAPACRRSSGAVYDPVGNKLIVIDGRSATAFYDDSFSYDLSGNTWTNLNPQKEIHMSVPVSGLADNTYHWQYRTSGSVSGLSSFRSFGSNSDTLTAATDFSYCANPTIDRRMRLGTFFCGEAMQRKYLP